MIKAVIVKDWWHVAKVAEALAKNDGYCPCQLEKTDDTKCICKDFIENVSVGEKCHCGLYIKYG